MGRGSTLPGRKRHAITATRFAIHDTRSRDIALLARIAEMFARRTSPSDPAAGSELIAKSPQKIHQMGYLAIAQTTSSLSIEGNSTRYRPSFVERSVDLEW
jgi:hypothetical protein